MTCIAGVFGTPLIPQTDAFQSINYAAARRSSHPISVLHWDHGAVIQGSLRHSLAHQAGRSDSVMQRLAIVWTGQLTNRAELAQNLGRSAETDEQVLIAAAYRAWGQSFVERLEGRFALIIWDDYAQIGLCARDAYGQSPLYYSASGDCLFLASDVQMLLAFPQVSRDINQTSLNRYLRGLPPLNEQTYFAAIRRLPAGARLTWSQGETDIQTFWSPQSDIPYTTLPFQDQIDRFRTLLKEAVLPTFDESSAPVFFLSGGLDSSSITAAARKWLNAPKLQAVSMILSEDPEMNERRDQQSVAALGGIEVTEIDGSKIDYLASLDQILFEQAGPTLGAGMGLSFHTYLAAEALGADVVFDGHGGDETISYGGGRLHELRRDRKWLSLFYELLRVDPQNGMASIAKLLTMRPPLSYLRNGIQRLLPPSLASQDDRAGTSFLATGVDIESEAEPTHRIEIPYPDRIEQASHLNIVSDPLQAYAFETLDNLAGRRKLRMHYPLWDRRLVEFCLSLPPESKLRHGFDRYILREAMRGILPERIRRKKAKCDFSRTALASVRRDRRAEIDDLFINRLPQFSGLIDQKKAEYVYDNFNKEDTTASTGFLMQSIWKLNSAVKWLDDPTGQVFAGSKRPVEYKTINVSLNQDGSNEL